jgi:hypothetical protein
MLEQIENCLYDLVANILGIAAMIGVLRFLFRRKGKKGL